MTHSTIKFVDFSRDEFISLLREAFQGFLPAQQNEETASSDFFTREQTSKLLNVSFTTLFHWNNNGILPARKIGKKVFYLKQDVLDKLNGREGGAVA